MPRISIVTISYNQIDFLPLCVESIESQDYDDYEHIIVDPGSSDGSREWLAANLNSKRRLVFEADSGPADGLNNGLAHCRGEIFIYLNADDELPPGALQRIDELHRQNAVFDVIIGNGWTIDHLGNPVKHVISDGFSPFRYALSVGTVLQQATSFKRAALGTDLVFNVRNRVNWDTEFLFDAAASNLSFTNVPDCLGFFRLQENSITVSGRFASQLKAKRQELTKHHSGRATYWVGQILSPITRCYKRARSIRAGMTSKPSFPGLSRLQKDF
ncbi:glycosyltransferase [Pseudarthrobacter sulfonivorans]|uniref:glycosyltransferase n=1 Tax=Pseudarthrobacter sulfonivorans TaxID=121292 RepID=UPI002861EB37|nr:glycosyltransferase [Pseudarthrobacter sulfonivorans]MDR6413290.1 glycosyltransferase involved in cell wall biosynthesis [Pseudarthrobacter sulfonivorans]